MSRDRGSELQDHHNNGERDCSEGKHEPPHTIIPFVDAILYGGEFENEMIEDNNAYRDGWSHTYNQK